MQWMKFESNQLKQLITTQKGEEVMNEVIKWSEKGTQCTESDRSQKFHAILQTKNGR